MNKQNSVLKGIVKDNKEFANHLLRDIIKIVLTIVALKFIMIILDIFFTEKPKIIEYMEIASYIGIVIIFIIHIAIDVYETMITAIERGKKTKKGRE